MRYESIPVNYYPTTVIFIGNSKCLKEINSIIDNKKYIPKLFDDYQEAVTFLKKYKPHHYVEQRCLYKELIPRHCYTNIHVDFLKIRNSIYINNRFSEISAVIIDDDMKNINLLEICKQFCDMPFKKMIITRKIEEKSAIEAFNNGFINKFIHKGGPHFKQIINDSIHDLQMDYFQDMSNIIIKSLVDSNNIHWALHDPAFIQFFHHVCQKNDVVEYYLADECGSYLLFDSKGHPIWLAVKDEFAMSSAYETAKHNEMFSEENLHELKNNHKILFMFETCGREKNNVSDQMRSLHSAKTLKGKNGTYYYALIKKRNAYDIEKATPFSKYTAPKLGGRPLLDSQQVNRMLKTYGEGKSTVTDLCKIYHISRASFYNYLRKKKLEVD